MANPTDPSQLDGFGDEATVSNLDVLGSLPPGLSGRLLAIGPYPETGTPGTGHGVVHSVHLHAGRALSYRSRRVRTDPVAKRLGVERVAGPTPAGPDVVADSIVVFGGVILGLGNGSLAYELSPDLDTLRRVDLAGQSRVVSSTPKRDPATGDLHLIASATDGAQAYVVVSSGALTRRSRPILDPPHRIAGLAITRHGVVFIANGFIGVTSHDAQTPITWIATGVNEASLVAAHDAGEVVVALTVTPSLERWTLHVPSEAFHREILNSTPRRFALASDHVSHEPQFLWAIGDETVDKYDLATDRHSQHNLGPRHSGDLAFVADSTRSGDADGGWLVGFVRHPSGDEADLVVLDAADIAHLPIATVRLPRLIPRWLHSTWVPSTQWPTTTDATGPPGVFAALSDPLRWELDR